MTPNDAKFSFHKKIASSTGNDKVTELLRCLAVLWLSLAFCQEKNIA